MGCYDEEDLLEFLATPRAEPGDVWRIHWYKEIKDGAADYGPLAGYAICCPTCKHAHAWTTAGNCSKPVPASYVDDGGNVVTYKSCAHAQEREGSCWEWTGSAEGNLLTANPSLLILDPACGFHGWLKEGVLSSC